MLIPRILALFYLDEDLNQEFMPKTQYAGTLNNEFDDDLQLDTDENLDVVSPNFIGKHARFKI